MADTSHSPHLPPHSLATIHLFFVFIGLPILNISYKWDTWLFVTGFIYHKYIITVRVSTLKLLLRKEQMLFWGDLI